MDIEEAEIGKYEMNGDVRLELGHCEAGEESKQARLEAGSSKHVTPASGEHSLAQGKTHDKHN